MFDVEILNEVFPLSLAVAVTLYEDAGLAGSVQVAVQCTECALVTVSVRRKARVRLDPSREVFELAQRR